MEAARQRYASDERVQLDTLADHFVSVFRDAELPFNKLLAEQPLPKVHLKPSEWQIANEHWAGILKQSSFLALMACTLYHGVHMRKHRFRWLQVAKTPADAVPADVAQAVSDFMAAKDAAAVAAFAGALIDAAFDAMPESASRLQQAPPKANVSLPLPIPVTVAASCLDPAYEPYSRLLLYLSLRVDIKDTRVSGSQVVQCGLAQVGLLVVLALALRAKPAALVLDADRLAAGGRRYTAPGRLPLLLWLLAQSAQ